MLFFAVFFGEKSLFVVTIFLFCISFLFLFVQCIVAPIVIFCIFASSKMLKLL